MSALREPLLPEANNCTICLETCRDPVFPADIPTYGQYAGKVKAVCEHHFCKRHLEKWALEKKWNVEKQGCPNCREPFTLLIRKNIGIKWNHTHADVHDKKKVIRPRNRAKEIMNSVKKALAWIFSPIILLWNFYTLSFDWLENKVRSCCSRRNLSESVE